MAAFGRETGLVVIVEERIEPGAVDVDVGRVDDAQAPGFAAEACGAGAERGIVQGCLRRKRREGIRVRLHIPNSITLA